MLITKDELSATMGEIYHLAEELMTQPGDCEFTDAYWEYVRKKTSRYNMNTLAGHMALGMINYLDLENQKK